ncbi:cytochrome C assembly family protein [Hydrogenovibrio marinus]|uniref:Cytochrome C biogenesis protein n=1 Tax=Hydrogenovibrio marinus TaxID=28885 RepID=A0A066ZP87_HYDMR|nr:cytochrome c biogenesis protein CcsA [Hydrogenovibrio marinus]KDN95317.1 cytochrome C biogenesis protein [Hydrogenovibrio marinus]BBN59802.1 membrane protein [Hydrogenovibrio marinus]
MYTATILLATLSSLLYFYTTYMLWRRFDTDTAVAQWPRSKFLTLIVFAAVFQFLSFAGSLYSNGMILFSFGTSLSLISWLAVLSLLATNLNNTTENLGIFIFPIAGITSLMPFMSSEVHPLPTELGSHVLISVSAYSIMGLATAQAILYSAQEKRFRKKELSTLFRNLPPLQVMEKILVQLVMIGFVLLSFSLLSGAFFMEDMFAQHLIHKTFFAILAWLTYGVFLIGHFRFGWRGQKAAYYTIWAYFLLILSYIGTEVVLLNLN